MATAIKDSLTDHSPLDGTNDAINGAEVDANTDVISQILDGTTATDLATDSTIDFRFTSSRAGIRLIDTDNAGGAIHYGLDMEWDPGDGGQMTDGSSGVGMRFLMPDAADTQTAYARMYVLMRDDTAASDDAEFVFEAAVGGTLTTELLHMSQPNGIVFNDDSGDIDFRIEGANTANGFLLDAGQDAISLGGANVDGAAFTLNNLQSRTAITSVGSQLHIPAQTTNFDNSSGTIAIGAAAFIGIPTWTNASSTLTITHAASLYIQGVPVDSTNVTATNTPYALWVDAGATQLDGAVTVGGNLSVGGTVQGTTITATTAFVPDASDGAALGTSSLEFSDLFLADGAVINFGDDQDITLTHSADAGLTTNGTFQATTITATTAFVPDASDGAALGTTALEFSDLFLADGAVINFGDDQDVSLTHVADAGLLLSSTDQLQFGDSGTYIFQSADGVLDLVSDTEIEINATTIDINGAVAMDGAMSGGTNITISGELDAATLDISGAIDVAGTTNLDVVDIDGAVQIDGTVTVGVNGTGKDVKFFGDTAGKHLLWDESADTLIFVNSFLTFNDADSALGQVFVEGASGTAGNMELRTSKEGGVMTRAIFIDQNQAVSICDGSNANVTQGLTIHQGANDDLIFALKGTITTAVTSLPNGNDVQTDDFFTIEQAVDDSGGAHIQVLGESGCATPLIIETYSGSSATTDTSGSLGAMNFFVGEHAGANDGADMGADTNAIVWGEIEADTTRLARMILKADDGELHLTDTTLVALDAEEDVLIVRAMQRESSSGGILDSQWDNPFYNYDKLQEFGLAGEKDKDGVFLYPLQSRLNAHEGAIWQTYCGFRDMQEVVDYQQEEIKSLKQELRLLKEK